MGQPTRPTQPSIPPGSVNEFMFYINYGSVDHWNGRLDIRAAVWLQAKVCDPGLGLRPRLYAGPVCDDIATEAVHATTVALYKWTLLSPFSYVRVVDRLLARTAWFDQRWRVHCIRSGRFRPQFNHTFDDDNLEEQRSDVVVWGSMKRVAKWRIYSQAWAWGS